MNESEGWRSIMGAEGGLNSRIGSCLPRAHREIHMRVRFPFSGGSQSCSDPAGAKGQGSRTRGIESLSAGIELHIIWPKRAMACQIWQQLWHLLPLVSCFFLQAATLFFVLR